jgi:hypothetical protein
MIRIAITAASGRCAKRGSFIDLGWRRRGFL